MKNIQKLEKIRYLIHFAGYQKPWDIVDCDFAEYFWEYAKLSPYYPMILRKIKRCLMEEQRGRVVKDREDGAERGDSEDSEEDPADWESEERVG